MKNYFKVYFLVVTLILLFVNTALGGTCQLNSGAYIAHEKRYINEAWSNVSNGKWGNLYVMWQQGKLKKVNTRWNITPIEVGENIVKFKVKCAPGKEIFTLKIFTNCKEK
jgi:hypothetical protein